MATEDDGAERLDRWLWAVRLFRTRSLATAACRAGSVTVAGLVAKPARLLRAGERVVVKQGLVERTLVVVAHPPARVGARLVARYCEDRTPPEEFAKARQDPVGHVLAREKGSGRPTKQDRRALDAVFRPAG